LIAALLILALHCCPGDAVRGFFSLRGTMRRVFLPRIVEGTPVDLLRMKWQMSLYRRRKVVD
jgi:alpha-D-ribose 1-methylphosphonate 5-triphosphate synthase subunit PhnI